MLKNLKIASRYLFKHKEYSLINIGGLAFSLVCVFFIALYLFDELSFDRFHNGAENIYRVIEDKGSETGEETSQADVAFRLSSIQDEIPEIVSAVKLTTFGRRNVSNVEKTINFHYDAIYADQSFLEIFDYPLIRGDRNSALQKANSVILSEMMAKRFFNSIDVVGQTLLVGNDVYQVTGVLKDFPSNTHLDLQILYSMESQASQEWYKRFQAGDWSSNYFVVYYKLIEGANVTDIAKRLNDVVKANRPDDATPSHFWLQPITDIHFYSANITGGGNARQGEISYIYVFGAVGLFLLIIACVNYINLSTAFAITRGKEIGIKKVAGAHRSNLIAQFITESTFIAFVSVLLALGFVNALLPQFNEFTGKTIELNLLFQLPSILMLSGFTLLIGFLSGSYPAFYLSKLKPAMTLKGFSKGQGSAWMRKGLVVFQFTLSIMLIIASITAYRQIQYIRSKNLGFNQEQLVMLDINSGKVRRGADIIKTELLRLPAAESVTLTSRVPGEWKNLLQVRITTAGQPEGIHHYMIGADEDFLSTFEINLVKGRNFLPGHADSLSVLINETAANLLGVTEPGYQISIPAVNYGASDEPLKTPFYAQVIGIVDDFHFQSLHQKIAPMVITHSTNPIQSVDYFTVRLNPGDMETTLKSMEKIIASVDADHPLEYNFLDERLADFYQEDLKRGKLFGISATVSIAIACLGLFSLASFNTEQRTKEIGIRKVLGASLGEITLLLSANYVKLVAAGFLIAAPLSFLALKEWLASFAYRIQIDVWILALAGMLSVIIALLTVGYKSIKAALADPVDSLRSE